MTVADVRRKSDGGNGEFERLRHSSRKTVRMEIRAGHYAGHTAGFGTGYLQGNVVILPVDFALDFFRFCQRNPKPCPLIGVSDTGNPNMFTLGHDIDIRRDVPKYNIYRDGLFAEQMTEIVDIWADDFVAFVLGCSFSFEEALIAEGIRLRHIDENSFHVPDKNRYQSRRSLRGPRCRLHAPDALD